MLLEKIAMNNPTTKTPRKINITRKKELL